MARVLGIVYRVIATHLIKKAGQTHKMAHTGAVTLIHWAHPYTQPFGRPAAVVIGNPANRSEVWIGAQSEYTLYCQGWHSMPRALGCAGVAHMLFLDGVYIDTWGATRFRWVKAPTSAELTHLVQVIARRVGRFLERQGLLERDEQNSYLAGDVLETGPMDQP